MPDGSQASNVGGVAADHLRSFVERVERLREEVKALNADIAQVYAEAKATGFQVPIMKLLIAERSKAEHELQERNELLDLYRAAVNGTGNATRARSHESDE